MPTRPRPDYAAVARAVAARDAGGFVHVGTGSDPDVRYLTGVDRSDAECAFVHVDGEAILCAPADATPADFPGTAYGPADLDAATPGERAAEVLAARGAAGAVLAPRHVPHDAALYLERAGFELGSTAAVAAARARKSDAELDCIRAAATAADAAVARVSTLLARANPDADAHPRKADPLTPERMRREANAAAADAGAAAGDATVSAPSKPDASFDPGKPVVASLSPRDASGYRAAVTRTFVPATDGGWERRAAVAVDRALDAAFGEAAAGTPAATVREEGVAELAAYGFDPTAVDVTGYGVGVARREAPSLTVDAELAADNVVFVEAAVRDADRGTVRAGDLAVVTEDGTAVLTDAPRSVVPRERT